VSTQYGLNGYTLPGKTQLHGMWLLKDTEYAPSLAPRRAVVEIPATHYQIPKWDDPMSAITLALKVRVQGTDPDNLRELWNDLTGLLGMGTNQPVQLTRIRASNIESADGQLVSTTSPDFFCDSNRADVQIIFNIPGGAWRGDYVEQGFAINNTTTSTVGSGTTMPIVDSLIRVPGPIGSVTIRDTVSDTSVNWTKSGSTVVPSGQYLLIDPYNMIAHIVTSPVWTFTGTDVSGRLVFQDLGPFTMTSRRSGPSLTVTSSVEITSTETAGPVVIRARTAVV
jgi:hypothetical protein